MRKQVEHVCPECETVFEGITRAVYCSNRCKQRAKNRRNREKSPE